MKKSTVIELPTDIGVVSETPTFRSHRGDLIFEIVFSNGREESSVTITFVASRASRERADAYCTAWHIEGAYERVCKIESSDWVESLTRDAKKEYKDEWVLNHFMIFAEDFGCLEVISERVELAIERLDA